MGWGCESGKGWRGSPPPHHRKAGGACFLLMKPLHSAHSPFVRNPSDFPFTLAGLFAVHRRPSLRHPWLRRRTLRVCTWVRWTFGFEFSIQLCIDPEVEELCGDHHKHCPVSHPTSGGFNYNRQQSRTMLIKGAWTVSVVGWVIRIFCTQLVYIWALNFETKTVNRRHSNSFKIFSC